jgi:hypothetical protein
MADGAHWIELFRKNGWLEGNKIVAPDKRGGVKKVLNLVGFSPMGLTDGAAIQIDFKDGSKYYVKTKADTIGDHVEWDDHFLTFYKYKDVDARRPWDDVTNAVLRG